MSTFAGNDLASSTCTCQKGREPCPTLDPKRVGVTFLQGKKTRPQRRREAGAELRKEQQEKTPAGGTGRAPGGQPARVSVHVTSQRRTSGKTVFSKWCRANGHTHERRPDRCLVPCTKVNPKWIKDLNARPGALRFLKENRQ